MTETGPEFIWPRNPPLYVGESADLEWLYVVTLYHNNKSDWRLPNDQEWSMWSASQPLRDL